MRGQIRKRGKSWSVIVYLGRNPETGKKQRKWYTHATRREAEAQLAQLLVQVQAGGGVPPTRLRAGDYLEQWLRDYAVGALAPSTLMSYTRIIHRHLIPGLGKVPLARLTAQAIQWYVSQASNRGLSSTTALYHYRVLHEALQHAVRWGVLIRNPADFVDPPRRRRLEMRVWDEEQVRLFLAEAKRSSPHYSLYLAAVLTGMRQGELLALRWKDVNFAQAIASIQQTFYRLNGKLIFREPKTAKARRTVALSPALIEELHRHRDAQTRNRDLWGPEYEDRDLVFCQSNGKPLHAHNLVERDFKRLIQRTGLPRIRFHDLRHSHATHLLRAGVHPKVVQERLGHSTPAFTLAVYSHVLPGIQEEAARIVEARLLGGGPEQGPAGYTHSVWPTMKRLY